MPVSSTRSITRSWMIHGVLVLAFSFGYRFFVRREPLVASHHPIYWRILQAEYEFQHLISSQTHSYEDSVAAYVARRRRDPPPGYTAWYNLARKYDAIVIEQFWDPIYEDLEPFWALSPRALRQIVQAVTATSEQNDVDAFWIRDGKPGTGCLNDDFCNLFLEMLNVAVQEGAGILPDVNIAFNAFISPRIWTPWEDVEILRQAAKTGSILEKDNDIMWKQGPALVQAACSPESSASRQSLPSGQVSVHTHANTFAHMKDGIVSDFQQSKSPCHQPDLLHLHGTFVAPNYQLTTKNLFPLFSVQRVSQVNHEIRIPSLLYWSLDERFYAPDIYGNWSQKENNVFWRGGNSGGRVNESNWQSFHRHRLVTMTNSTVIEKIMHGGSCLVPWAISDRLCQTLQNASIADANAFLKFVQDKLDIGFDAFGCVEQKPPRTDGISGCAYLDETYHFLRTVPLKRGQRNKFLVDVDGNGYSGRFHSFMFSNSVPIKATIYDEWHESRLVPWKHFVPMDNRFDDLWLILEYFFGDCMQNTNNTSCIQNDEEAMRIGVGGAEWAKRVLRKEDMTLYVLRLLLEYARILRDDRDFAAESKCVKDNKDI